MSFPAFSGRFAILIADAAAAPDDIPTCCVSLKLQNQETFIGLWDINTTGWIIKFIKHFSPYSISLHEHESISLTSKPSFNARALAVSIASSLEIWKYTVENHTFNNKLHLKVTVNQNRLMVQLMNYSRGNNNKFTRILLELLHQ